MTSGRTAIGHLLDKKSAKASSQQWENIISFGQDAQQRSCFPHAAWICKIASVQRH
jgi:hypothetical protein